MKKLTILFFAIVSVAFASCTKEIVPSDDQKTDGIPFSIVATPVETKTAYSEGTAVWADGDKMNVFHASTETPSTYVSDGEFALSNGSTFTGTLGATLSGNNNWYAIYPYKSQITTPASTSGGYQTIGSRSDKVQTQNGNNNMEHLVGANCPLYGIIKNVPSGTTPSFEMNQLCSVIAIVVKNTTSLPLNVSSVSFTGAESIVGYFYVNFVGENPVFTDGPYVSNTATLSVTNSTAIATNGEATFYLAIKPSSATSAQEIKVSVNGYEKAVPHSKDVSFAAGSIKKIKFDYDQISLAETIIPNNSFWGTSKDGSFSHNANSLDVSGTQGLVSITMKNGSSTNGFINDSQTRVYNGYTMLFSAATGYNIDKIEFTADGTNWAGSHTANVGTMTNNKTWDGNNSSVTIAFKGTCRITGIKVTCSKILTITGLTVSGTPTKTTYGAGEAFDPAGLTVTAAYDDGSNGAITSGFDWTIDYVNGGESFAAGETTVDVMASVESSIMSDVYTVTGLTVTAAKTLSSIAVSGSPTKTTYYAGEALDPAGLVVTGTYSDGSTATIPDDDIQWSFNPATLSVGTTSCNVTATAGGKTSAAYEVTGLTVTAVTKIVLDATSDKSFPKDGITVSVSNGTLTNGTDYRVYKSATMTITSTVGVITKIDFTYTSNSYHGGNWAASYQPNANSWTSPVADGAQARITKIVVTVAP